MYFETLAFTTAAATYTRPASAGYLQFEGHTQTVLMPETNVPHLLASIRRLVFPCYTTIL